MSDLQEQTHLLRQVRDALQENNYPQAIQSLQAVVTLARERGDIGAAGRHLGNLALTYYRMGKPDKALDYFGQALDCARQDQDRFTEDGLLGNMGNILREVGRYDDALIYLNEALAIAEEIGDNRGRGIWLSNLGLVYDDLRQPAPAIVFHQQAVEVARQLHDLPNLASRLGNLGNSYVAQGDYATALMPFSEAVRLYEQLNRPHEVALRLGIMGNLYAMLGRQQKDAPTAQRYLQQALEAYEKAAHLAKELGDFASQAELLRSIAGVLITSGQANEAGLYLSVAGQLFQALGMTEKAAEVTAIQYKIAKRKND